MGSSGSRLSRASLGALILLGFLWFLFVCLSVNRATTVTVRSSGNSKLLKLIETESKHAVHRDYGLNYVSKRRVPNGPDPIHNRSAFNNLVLRETCIMAFSILVFVFNPFFFL
ncbi:hypothetical protein LguiA_018536 [Lonicera macranthoides]